MTKLSTFIRDNAEEILSEWETFARSLAGGDSMDIAQLRDHAREMLDGIARDLDTPQTPQQHAEEAKGQTDTGDESATAAQSHGAGRAEQGFSVAQMVAEFRALRATVIRLWTRQMHELVAADMEEMAKFHEAIDQAIAESITRYTRELSRSKDRFLGILGHDLRTPLSSIAMSASFLLETVELREPVLARVTSMANSAKRMNQMVADLLDFARTQFGGDMRIVRAEMDARTMIEDVISEMATSHPNSDMHVDASGDLRGEWDANRLAQALTNLIANGVQHGSPESPINISAHGTPEEVVISVRNQGPVIPTTRLREIFAASQDKPDSPRGSDHLGLGLYIVDRIVRAHGGTIDAASSAERGTTFTVCLPRHAAH
jgi:signal transduction histidine kinase